MNYPVHIFVLLIATILVFTLYFILRIHFKTKEVLQSDDFITVYLKRKQKQLDESGTDLTLTAYMVMLAMSPIALGIAGYLFFDSGLMAVATAAFGLCIPDIVIKFMIMRTRKNFEERYLRSLDQLGASLRAGKSVQSSVEDVANCTFLHPSIRKKYAQIYADMQVGIPISDAFTRFAESTDSVDAKDVAMAITIQNKVGGRERDLINSISINIRNRIMMRREIQSAFAATQSMAYIMDVMPYVIMIFFVIGNQSYLEAYTSSPTMIAVFVMCLVFPAIGAIITDRALRRVKKGI